jgi:DNA-binding MarR family transcriptional regulator
MGMLTSATRAADLADRLHSAAIHVLRRVAREDVASGLGAPALSALSVVVFGGPLSLGRLAEAERVRPPTMTRTVQGLESAGLIRREQDPADKRVVNIEATRKGIEVLQAARARRVAALASSLEGLGEGDLGTLERAADLLARLASR